MNKKVIKRTIDKISSIISYFCVAILFLVAIFLTFYIISNQIAKSKGTYSVISLFTIVSPSMEPSLNVYDVVMELRVKDENTLKKGDIITFYSDAIDTGGYTITHRILKIYEKDGEKRYITKGDNNLVEDDGYITKKNIVGKVYFIFPKLGKVQLFVSSKLGWFIVILIPAVSIILLDLFKLLKVYRIKNETEEIPDKEEIEKIKEEEQNKKIKKLVEEADKLSKK